MDPYAPALLDQGKTLLDDPEARQRWLLILLRLAAVLAAAVTSCAGSDECTDGYFDCGGMCVDLAFDSTN